MAVIKFIITMFEYGIDYSTIQESMNGYGLLAEKAQQNAHKVLILSAIGLMGCAPIAEAAPVCQPITGSSKAPTELATNVTAEIGFDARCKQEGLEVIIHDGAQTSEFCIAGLSTFGEEPRASTQSVTLYDASRQPGESVVSGGTAVCAVVR